MSDLVTDLQSSRSMLETHISWVFLETQLVFKVKKPVRFGFLDFTSLERRRVACEAEVRLNRRLAAETYLDVVPVCLDRAGVHHFEAPGEVVDWAVKMQRLPDSLRADRLLAERALTTHHIDRIADRIVHFHEQADRGPGIAAFGSVECVRKNVTDNFDETAHDIASYLNTSEVQRLSDGQLGFIDASADVFRERLNNQRVCEGHGDLRLEHVYLTEPLRIIDCCEFDAAYRCSDVASDLAFLAMDLVYCGRRELAERLLARYAQSSGDYDLYTVIDFYMAYRAMVRAKVACLRASQRSEVGADASLEQAQAKQFFLQALPPQQRLAKPQIVAVAGLIASGKSTVSAQISEVLNCPVVDSDRTRKVLIGVGAEVPVLEDAFSGNYSSEFTQRVYSELFRRAEVVMASGRSVVIDASFSSADQRRALANFADRRALPVRLIECVTSREEALRRIALRSQQPSPSDGRAEIYDAFAAKFEPIAALPPSITHEIWETGPLVAERIRRSFGLP